ncbi:MAG: DUF4331 family protein [Pyrinomonadaceae bacterium]
MNFKKFATRAISLVLSIGMLLSSFGSVLNVRAADHRDSQSVDAIPEGDLTDVFAFVDPANTGNVVLILPVNPFLVPAEGPSVRFGEDLLYQFKINNGGDDREDLVVQFNFGNGRGPQTYDVVLGTPSVTGPNGNTRISGTTLCSGGVGSVNVGSAVGGDIDSHIIVDNTTGSTCYAGVADDSFQTDVAQAVFRIGLNPNPTGNAANHTQDVFRGFVSVPFGPLRGRALRADLTSGSDGFGGFNTSIMAVSLPKSLLRGSGIRVPNAQSTTATLKAANPSFIGVWGTVSRPTSESFDGFNVVASDTYEQFERMGQQLANTVWIFGPNQDGSATFGFPALGSFTTAEIKDLYNASGPETDWQNFSRYVPDSLVTCGGGLGCLTGGIVGANFIESRRTLLTAGGFTAPGGVTGVSAILPQLPNNIAGNRNNQLMRQLVMPDMMRLNLDLLPSGTIQPGAGGTGTGDPILSIASWGVQNGRRPADDVTDIYLRLARELTDVKFPDNLLVLGLGTGGVAGLIPGAAPQGNRHSLQCTQLQVTIVNPQILQPCEDARIFAVLQGTDFIEQLPTDVENVANQVSQQRVLRNSFPYLSINPVPGEAGTTNFPPQQ